MKNFVLFFFCVTVAYLQLSVEGVFFSERRIPDLALALVITFVLTMDFDESLKWIALTGALLDAGSTSVFGSTILSFFLIGWLISYFAIVVDLRSRKTLFLFSLAFLTAISEIAKDLLLAGGLGLKARYFQEKFVISQNFFSLDYALKIFYTVLVVYLVYYIFRRASRALFLEPVRLAKRF